MDTLFDQYKDILKKNLPQHVGETLQDELSELQRLRKRVKELDDRLAVTLSELNNLKKLKINVEKLDKEWADLSVDQEEFEQEKRSLEIQKLQHKLECETDKVNFSRELLSGLVRNTIVRKNIFDSETSGQPVTDGHGVVHYPVPTNKQHDETQEDT